MDSAWIASWLAYVQFDRKAAPAPGPCNNRRLITYDYSEKRYVGRSGLIMARKDFGGDYRRVSKEVWELFCEYYPGSGPTITMVFELAEKNEKGFYDTSKWTILDPPPAPEDATIKKKKKLINIQVPMTLKRQLSARTESKATDDPAARDSTSLLTKPLPADDPNTSNILAMTNPTANTSDLIGEDSHAADSDDDIDVAPLNSFAGKTKNDPKLVSLNVNYSKVSEEKKESIKESQSPKRDSVSASLLN